MRLPKLDRFLAADPDLQPIIEKALTIDAVAKLCASLLPSDLAQRVRVSNVKGDRVVLVAANPADAARLRLYGEKLTACLSQTQGQAIVISVKVQPNISREKHGASHNRPELTDKALAALLGLYNKLPDSPARRALHALLEHHHADKPTPRPTDARTETAGESAARRRART
jgi:hypothetical protein